MRTARRWLPARPSAWPPHAPELAPMANDRTPCERASTSRPAPAPGGSGGHPPVGSGTSGGAWCRWIRPAPRSSSAPPGPSPHARRAAPPAGLVAPAAGIAAHLDQVTHAATSPVASDQPSTVGHRSPRSAPPGAAHPRFATVPTAADRPFMEGTSDAGAVGLAVDSPPCGWPPTAAGLPGGPAAGPVGCSARRCSTASRSATASWPASAIRRRSTCSSARAGSNTKLW
jgi:hypothetical protein